MIIFTSSDYTYNYNIDWGDGLTNRSVTGNITHTYDIEGEYTIEINGTYPFIQSNCAGQLNFITQWGTQPWKSMSLSLFGTTNYNNETVIKDKPNLEDVLSCAGMFFLSRFNQSINDWNVSSVTDMDYIFCDAEAFTEHDLSGWSVDNVTDHNDFMDGAGADNIEPNWNIPD